MLCTACGREIMSEAVYCPYCETQVEGAVEPDDYVYEAFISYRHLSDDRAVAMRIQRGLEGASIPRELREKSGRKRLGRLFRDEDELSTTASLSNTIVDALKKSRFLIVVCSPQTRESEWVLREVETFASLHGRDRILIALASGEPYESFPPLLLSSLVWDDDSEAYTEVKAEPLAANFRDKSFGSFRREVLRLESSILDCGYDDLLQRIRMRRLRVNMAISAVLLVGAIAFGAFVLSEKFLVEASFQMSQVNESKLLAREARDYLEGGNRIESLRASLNALVGPSWNEERPFVSAAQYSLETALGVFPKLSPWTGLYSIEGVGSISDNYNGVQALVEQGNYVVVSDVVSGDRLMVVVPPSSDSAMVREEIELRDVKLGKSTLLCAYGTNLFAYDYKKGTEAWSEMGSDTSLPSTIIYLEKSKQFAVFYQGIKKEGNTQKAPVIRFYDEMTGDVVRNIELVDVPSLMESPIVAVSTDESAMAIAMLSYGESPESIVVRFTIDQMAADNRSYLMTTLAHPYISDLSFVEDSIVAVTHTVSEVFTIDSYSFEFLDASLAHQWAFNGSLHTFFDDDGNALSTNASVVGPVPSREGETPDICCVCGTRLITLDGRTGERLSSESMGEPIVDAFLVSRPDEPVTIAGCTVDGSVFLRTPEVNSVKTDKLNKETFAPGLYDVQMIEDEQGFLGLAAWTTNPTSYHVYTINDLRRINTLRHVPDASSATYAYGSRGETLLCVKDDELRSIDPNTFETAWRCPLASMGLADTTSLRMIIADDSVLVFDKMATLDSLEEGRLPVYELSIKDGSLIAKHLLPLGDMADYLESNDIGLLAQYCKAKDGRRLMATGILNRMLVFVLDDDSLAFEESEGDSFFIWSAWLGEETIALRCLSNYSYMKLYSLETGKPIEGEITDYFIDTSSSAAICLGGKDNELLTVCCKDGFLRCFSMTDGSLKWCGPVETRNPLFVCEVSDNRILAQDSSGRTYLLNEQDGSLVATSEIRLFQLKDCIRKDEGDGTASLLYSLPGIYDGTGIVVLDFNDAMTFGPLSEAHYGFFLSQDKKQVLAKTPWSNECLVYPRKTLEEMTSEAQTLVSSFDVLDEYVDVEYSQKQQDKQ